jgi:hypothetical protein
MVWETEGGISAYVGSPSNLDNYSEVLGWNPSTPQNICTYIVPFNSSDPTPTKGPSIYGITSTGTGNGTTIWFMSQDTNGGLPRLESFEPYDVGMNCSSTTPYQLSGAPSFTTYATLTNNWPNEIAADPNPSDPYIWATNTFGDLEGTSYIQSLSTTTGAVVHTYDYTPPNAYNEFQNPTNGVKYPWAYPWNIVADQNYVYAIDAGDADIIQIEKHGPAPNTVNIVPIPVTSDKTAGEGLALQNGKLYFTTDGSAGNVGVIDVGAWENASQACGSSNPNCAPLPTSATEYSGVLPAADSSGNGSLSDVAVAPGGELAITNYDKQVIRLIPTTSVLVPSSGASLSGTAATLDAFTYDPTASSVKFYLNGSLVATATLTLYGWLASWNSTTVADGNYSLTSTAYNSGGTALGSSSPVSIVVNN